MNATETMTVRARALLELVGDKGLRITIPNLEATARRTWGALTEAEIDELAAHALGLHRSAAPSRDDDANPDWPIRTVRRTKPESPAPAPAPVAVQAPQPAPAKLPHARPGTAAALQAPLRALLQEQPALKAKEAYELLRARGVNPGAFSSFQGIYLPQARKALGIDGRTLAGRIKSERATVSSAAPKPVAAREPNAARAEAVLDREMHAAHAAAEPEAAEPAPPTPGPDVEIEAEKSDDDAPTKHAPPRGSTGRVEFQRGEDFFLATLREDGDWDVRMEIKTDLGTMDRLAEVIYRRAILAA